MKAKLIIMVTISAFQVICPAQTKDFMPRINIDGRVYTNAEIRSVTAGDAIVIFEGGGKRMRLQDLPEPFRSKYYDPQKASEYERIQTEKKLAISNSIQKTITAKLQQEAYRGTPKRMAVKAITSNFGHPQCIVSTERQPILITGLPQSVSEYLASVDSLSAAINGFSEKVKSDERKADRLDAVAPTYVSGSPQYVAQQKKLMDEASMASVEAKHSAEDLRDMIKRLNTLRALEKSETTIIARVTGKRYGQMQIWECLGLASSFSDEEIKALTIENKGNAWHQTGTGPNPTR